VSARGVPTPVDATSGSGQKLHFERRPIASGLPLPMNGVRAVRYVSKVAQSGRPAEL
jgi:hypothetical protein